MSSGSDPATIEDSSHFSSTDADFLLLSTNGDKRPSRRFKVHSTKLIAASPVFADMFALGKREAKQAVASKLPSIQLTESTSTMHIVLRYIYADSITAFPDFKDLSPIVLLEILDAAIKYAIPALQLLVETLLSAQATRITDSRSALEILERACTFGRKDLASLASEAYIRCYNNRLAITSPLLETLPAEGLVLLMKANDVRLEKKDAENTQTLWRFEQSLRIIEENVSKNPAPATMREIRKDLKNDLFKLREEVRECRARLTHFF